MVASAMAAFCFPEKYASTGQIMVDFAIRGSSPSIMEGSEARRFRAFAMTCIHGVLAFGGTITFASLSSQVKIHIFDDNESRASTALSVCSAICAIAGIGAMLRHAIFRNYVVNEPPESSPLLT